MRLFAILAMVIAALTAYSFKQGNEAIHDVSFRESFENGIQFIEEDWQKALLEAKKQNKLIFLDAYATWCGPCRLLKKKTFPDGKAGAFFNKHFINVAVDVEKGAGPGIARKYGISGLPTLMIIDAAGKPVTYTVGFINPAQLIEFGEHGLAKSGRK